MAMLRNLWSGLVELLRKPASEQARAGWRDLKFFLRFAEPIWGYGVAALALLLLGGAIGALFPLSTKVIIDFVVMKKPATGVVRILEVIGLGGWAPGAVTILGSLNHVVAAICGASVLAGVLLVCQQYLMTRFQQEVAFNLETALFEHVLRFPLSFFHEKQTGYIMSRITDDVRSVQILFSQRVPQLLHGVLQLMFGVGISFALSRRLACVALCVLPVYLLISRYFAGRVRHQFRNLLESRSEVSRGLQEVLSGVELVKSCAGEDREAQRYASRVRGVLRKRVKSLMLAFLSSHLVRMVRLLTSLLITWLGVREILSGRMSIGDFVAFSSYVVYLSIPAQMLSVFHMSLQPVFASLDRLLELFQFVPEIVPGERGHRGPSERIRGEIEFRGVTFCYEEGRPVLRDVGMRMVPGEVVALVGPSGAGKSTLVGLVLAFHPASRGTVLVDGQDVAGMDLQWLRRQVGFVAQETFLFSDSIRNNIRYGDPEADDDAVIQAAKAAHIHEDIVEMAEGYDTVVGERGVGLSVGQKQRVSIARAFLTDPPVLVLDEPTSAIDARAEGLVKASLKALIGRRTTLIVAHRLTTIDFADRIVVLDGGSIVEQGTHEGLMQSGGLYRRLYEEQFGGRQDQEGGRLP